MAWYEMWFLTGIRENVFWTDRESKIFKNQLFLVTSETTAHNMGLNGNSFGSKYSRPLVNLLVFWRPSNFNGLAFSEASHSSLSEA